MKTEFDDLRNNLMWHKKVTTENEDYALDLVRFLKQHLINFNFMYYGGIFTLEILAPQR